MATISKRSISSTFRPLSEMWDENGRIRPPRAEETQEPLTPEEEVRAEGVRMAARKQRDMAADEQRNEDIETFIKDPETFFGATVRRADFGVKEFSFGGRRVYTYNADAEAAERDALAKLDERKTFAELLTVDMPGKIDVAARLWTEGGDRDGARAEISAVDAFVKDNYDTLVTLTRYNGQDQLAANIADKARGMISGAYKVPFSTMDRDPEIKARVAQKRAADLGLNGDAADMYEKAVLGDADARALLSAAGASTVDQRPSGSGNGATPQAAKAAAAGVDLVDVNQFSTFAKTAYQTLMSSLGAETFGLLSASDRAEAVRDSYTAAGPGAGQALLNIAAGSVSTLAGQEKADAFRSAVGVGTSALQAWGAGDDPAKRARGVKVLGALSSALPGTAFTANRQQVADTMTKVAGSLDSYRNAGVEFSDEAAATFAKVLFKRAYRPSEALTGEEGRVSNVLNEAYARARSIVVPSGAAATPGEPPKQANDYELLAGEAREYIQGAAAAAVANRTALNDELLARSGSFAQSLMSLGASNADGAKNGARILALWLSSGGTVDFSKLPEALKEHPTLRPLIQTAEEDTKVPRGKSALLPSPKEAVDMLRATAIARSEARLKEIDKARGVTRNQASISAAAATGIESDTDISLFRSLMSNIPENASSDVLTGSEKDRPALQAAFTKTMAPAVSRVLFELSPMFKYLYEDTPVKDLDSPEVKEAAIQKVIDAYKAETTLGSALSDPAVLRSVAEDRVTRTSRNIRQMASVAGASLDEPAKRTIDVSQPVGSSFSTAAEAAARRPHVGRLFGGVIGYAAEEDTPEKVAEALFTAFSKGVQRTAPGESSFAADVRAALLSAAGGVRPPQPDKTPEQAPKINLALVGNSKKVLSGYNALKEVSDFLGKPIQNAAVNQLVTQDLPELMRGLPRSMRLKGTRLAQTMAREGKSTDEIMGAFESSFAAAEQRAVEAKQAAEAKVSVLGGAEIDEAAPNAK